MSVLMTLTVTLEMTMTMTTMTLTTMTMTTMTMTTNHIEIIQMLVAGAKLFISKYLYY